MYINAIFFYLPLCDEKNRIPAQFIFEKYFLEYIIKYNFLAKLILLSCDKIPTHGTNIDVDSSTERKIHIKTQVYIYIQIKQDINASKA